MPGELLVAHTPDAAIGCDAEDRLELLRPAPAPRCFRKTEPDLMRRCGLVMPEHAWINQRAAETIIRAQSQPELIDDFALDNHVGLKVREAQIVEMLERVRRDREDRTDLHAPGWCLVQPFKRQPVHVPVGIGLLSVDARQIEDPVLMLCECARDRIELAPDCECLLGWPIVLAEQ